MADQLSASGAGLVRQAYSDVASVCRTDNELVVFLRTGEVSRYPINLADGTTVDRIVFLDNVTIEISQLTQDEICEVENIDGSLISEAEGVGLIAGLLGLGAVALAMSGSGASAIPQPPLSISAVADDDTINGDETLRRVVVDGTGPSNRRIDVSFSGIDRTFSTFSNDAGVWSVSVPANSLPGGTYERAIVANVFGDTSLGAQATKIVIIDTEAFVDFSPPSSHAQLADGIINFRESQGVITLTGNAEPGSTSVNVVVESGHYSAAVDQNGNWTLNLPPGSVTGPSRDVLVTVTATDAAGNHASTKLPVRIDLENVATLMPQPVGADNVLTAVERSAGLTLTGTAEPGARVHVNFNGVDKAPVTADVNGNWTVSYASSELPQGELSSGTAGRTITVYSVDAAGNTSATLTHTLDVDTSVRNFTFAATDLIGAVNSGGTDASTLNAAERLAGLSVQGTVEPGSTVTINVGSWNQTIPASQTTAGTWAYTIPASALVEGNTASAVISVVARDQYGNVTQTLQQTIAVDTILTNFSDLSFDFGNASDGWVNATEASVGLAIRGEAEAGSRVFVRIGETIKMALADSLGLWTTNFSETDLPSGESTTVSTSITATDPAGNQSASYTKPLTFDTVAPDAPLVVKEIAFAGNAFFYALKATQDSYSFFSVDASGGSSQLSAQRSLPATETVDGKEITIDYYSLAPTIADGSYLVVQAKDTIGNESSTLYIKSDTAGGVDLSRNALKLFQISTLDLNGKSADLTLSDSQISSFLGPNKTMVVHGGSDDTVTFTGVAAPDKDQIINGHSYSAFVLGQATVLIDDDIRRSGLV